MSSSGNNSKGIFFVVVPLLAVAAGSWIVIITSKLQRRRKIQQQQQQDKNENDKPTAYETLIANGTPLIKLEHVSELVKRNIYVKMESLNPGGTGKDRAALSMIQYAEDQGILPRPISIQKQQQKQQQTINTAENNKNLKDDDNVSCSSSSNLKINTTNSEHSNNNSNNNNNDSNKNSYSKNDNNDTTNTTTNNNTSILYQLEQLIRKAMKKSKTGGLVIEGTSGSTGIALATLCISRGHGCLVILPDDQAIEKQKILTSLGAIVYVVPTAAISNPYHYVNLAKKAKEVSIKIFGTSCKVLFSNQFENPANFYIHYTMTGPELYNQLQQQLLLQHNYHHNHSTTTIDAFVMSSGTGGTISGIGKYLKEKQQQSNDKNNNSKSCQIVLVDPPGSALYNKIEYGVAYALEQSERSIRKHRYDTIAEGIGLDRITHNLSLGIDYIDSSIRVSDQEAIDMAHWILQIEGLWIGSSSAMNLVGTIRTALTLPPNSTVVTMICDGGQRHATRFWNREFVSEWGLEWPGSDDEPIEEINVKEESTTKKQCHSQRIPECLQSIILSTKLMT